MVLFTQQALLTGRVREYIPVISTEPEGLLVQHPALGAFAATRNERIVVRINSTQSIVIVEEGVNVNMDCFTWLRKFPGGTVQWLVQRRDENGQGRPCMVHVQKSISLAPCRACEIHCFFCMCESLCICRAQEFQVKKGTKLQSYYLQCYASCAKIYLR